MRRQAEIAGLLAARLSDIEIAERPGNLVAYSTQSCGSCVRSIARAFARRNCSPTYVAQMMFDYHFVNAELCCAAFDME